MCLLHSEGRSLRYLPGWGNPCLFIVVLYVGEGSERKQCPFQPAFSHFLCYPQAHWALLMLIPGGWVCVRSRTLWVSPTNSSVRPGVSPAAATPTGFYSQRFWGFISPFWNSGLPSLSCSPVVPPRLSAHKCGTAQSSSHHLARGPLHPGCPSPLLLPVWMKVSSLTPWLLDFHTVWFFGSSGYFFVFKCVVLLLVVRGGKAYLLIPPSSNSWKSCYWFLV